MASNPVKTYYGYEWLVKSLWRHGNESLQDALNWLDDQGYDIFSIENQEGDYNIVARRYKDA